MGYIKICPLTAFPQLPHPSRVSLARARSFFAHYFQVPATQARND